MNINNAWVEKYRPKTLEDIILPNSIKTLFNNGIEQPILLYGSAGIGKTTFAKLLAKDSSYLFMNCGLETSIDVVRERLIDFCSTTTFDDTRKVVIFDEFEGVSENFFKALRVVIEKYMKTTLFVATTNYITKLPESIQSRFEQINFNFTEKEEVEVMRGQLKRVAYICNEEGLTYDDDAIKALLRIHYPDMRSVISALQGLYTKGVRHIKLTDVKKSASIFSDLFEKIKTSTNDEELFSYVFKEYANSVDDVLFSLGREFPKYLIEIGKGAFIGDATVIVQKYSQDAKTSIDKPLCLWCCVHLLNKLIKK